MDFDDIQAEYNLFVEHLYNAHGFLYEILVDGSKYLNNYLKLKNFDKDFAEKFDENMLNLSVLYSQINDMLDALFNISITKIKPLEKNNIVNINEYINCPNKYEQDIYVDKSACLKWNS